MIGFEVCKGYKKEEVNIPKRQSRYSVGYDFETVEDVVIPSRLQIFNVFDDIINKASTYLNKVENLKIEDFSDDTESKEKLDNCIDSYNDLVDFVQEKVLKDYKYPEELVNKFVATAKTAEELLYENNMVDDYDEDLLDSSYKETLEKLKPTLIKTGIKAYFDNDVVLQLSSRSSIGSKGLVLTNGVGIIDSDYYENDKNDGEIMFSFVNLSHVPIFIKKGERIGQGIFQKVLFVDNEEEVTKKRNGGFGSTNKGDK